MRIQRIHVKPGDMMEEKKRILLIEDDPEDIELIHEMLEEFKGQRYLVSNCGSIAECSRYLDDDRVDIIALDLGLPKSNGLDTFDAVNRLFPNIPIVVLTGLTDDEVGHEAVRRGAQDYLIKGEVNANLLERVFSYSIQRKRASLRMIGLNSLKEDLLSPGRIQEKLVQITEWTVQTLSADFARIWITQDGDRCGSGCIHASATEGPHFCRYRDRCLRLMASSGRYTHLDGEVHTRVPFGCYKIGKIASGETPTFVTNDLLHDARVHNPEWVRDLGLVSFAGYQLRSPTGDPIGVMALFSKHEISPEEDNILRSVANTTAQVIMTMSFHEQLLYHADLLRNVLDAIISTDMEFNVRTWNRGAELMYGWTPEEAIGLNFSKLVSPEYPFDDRDDVLRTIMKSGSYHGMFIHHRKNGEPFSINGHMTLLRDENGTPTGAVAINRDITEQLASRTKLDRLNRKLEEKNRELGEIIYITSHDLRSPMVNIDGFSREIGDQMGIISGIIEGSNLDGEEKERINTILKEEVEDGLSFIGSSIRKIDSLIEGLLRISRLGTTEFEMENLDMNEMVKEVVPVFEFQVQECGGEITVGELPPCVGDSTRINQVLSNIIDNAIKYRDPDRALRIDISGGTEDEYSFYDITDTGIGIPERHLARVFSIFHRIDPRATPGEGLGLTAVRRILDKHDGSIAVTSRVGEGSTFRVCLPNTPLPNGGSGAIDESFPKQGQGMAVVGGEVR
jgi:two-component system, chemotaxis family, sensor kinase Cph1